MLNAISSSSSPVATSPRSDAAKPVTTGSATIPGSVETQISPLARLLADSTQLMETRVSSMPPSEQKSLADQAMNQISGPSYHARQNEYDRQTPQSDDPARLQLAASATAFLHARQGGKENVPNPFSGLSREQLTAIVNDDSGRFTVNERRAADYAASDLEQAWRRQAVQAARAEYESSGTRRGFFEEVLRHYQNLPVLEQARYPSDYVEQLKNRIRLEPEIVNHNREDAIWLPIRQLDKDPISNPQAKPI
ncbi:hypothetical protein [Chromobacterium sp. ASV23]|uniref:hypothetical protein n=1 Tax=Chromobacterium sp. ASV23 TaxID=2795110 RepID=UPI0018EC69D3|nr:hypothetical protein [Chromobacterium sp. ASV23]